MANYNQEISRIQNWVAAWCGTTEEDCPFSREDIRNICRGPMRDVLLDLMVPYFKTDDQIKVIRSNLYLNDISSQSQNEEKGEQSSRSDQQIKKLKHQLEQIHEEKQNVIRNITDSASAALESKLQAETELSKNLSNFELVETNTQLLRNRVNSTSALLQDIDSFKPSQEVIVSSTPIEKESAHRISVYDEEFEGVPSQFSNLNSLFQNASELFNNYFLQKYLASSKQFNSLSPEIRALSSNVSAQVADLTRSGISPGVIEKWARMEQNSSFSEIRKITTKFTNVMSPVEELASEVKALHTKLMKALVNIHFQRRNVNGSIAAANEESREKIQNAILKDGAIVPADFLQLVHQEELNRKLIKCRELTKKLRKIEYENNEDDLLAALDVNCSPVNEENSYNTGRSSVASTEGSSCSMKQETLEDLASVLIKSYPQSKSQLISTIQQCQSLVLDRFPRVNVRGSSTDKNNSQLNSQISVAAEVSVKDISLASELVFSNYKLSSFLVQDNNEHETLLGDVFKMQSELEKRNVQCEMIAREDKFSKLMEK